MSEIRFYHCMMCKRVYDGGWSGPSMTEQEFKNVYGNKNHPTSGICDNTPCKRRYKEYEDGVERHLKELGGSL